MAGPAIAAQIAAPPTARGRRLGRGATAAVVTLAAVAAALCFIHFGFTAEAFVGSFFAAVVLYLAAFDVRHHVIPNRVVVPAAAVVLCAQVAVSPDRSPEWLAAAAGAAAFFFATLVAYPAGLGMGDVKLAVLLGVALGGDVVAALTIGFLAAVPAALFLLIRGGAPARQAVMPYGPFLALGAAVVLLA
jgi:leader peptidase (prepilin peptidase)/N-methyltransferase